MCKFDGKFDERVFKEAQLQAEEFNKIVDAAYKKGEELGVFEESKDIDFSKLPSVKRFDPGNLLKVANIE